MRSKKELTNEGTCSILLEDVTQSEEWDHDEAVK